MVGTLLSRHHRMLLGGATGFNPATRTTYWLRNGTTGAISTIADRHGGTAAAQPTGVRQPNGAADGSMTFDTDCLLLPAACFHTTKFALGLWLEADNLTVQHYLFRVGPGASNDPAATESMVITIASDESLRLAIYNDATGLVARRAATAINVVTATPKFFTFEVDTLAAEADKVVITADLTELALTPADQAGTPGAFPAAMQAAPGDIMLGNRRSNLSTLPFIGRAGRDVFISAGVKYSEAVRGIWSATDRIGFKNSAPLV
jgi:hypothetical protein